MPHSKLSTILLTLLLSFLFLDSALAQQCSFHRECPTGTYCDGTCKAPQDALAPNGSLFWVDKATGNDTNTGSQSAPWKTIDKAARKVLAGDAVIIRAGTYREELRPRNGGTSSAFATYAAYNGEEVIITGADIVNQPGQNYNGWQQQGDGSWRHAWIWESLPSEGKYTADRRRELFVDNGQVIVQQSGSSRPSLQNGQFWVEGSDANPVAVYLKTFDGTNPKNHQMEVGLRQQLFYTYNEGPGSCGTKGGRYYRLIGLKFVHGTSKRQQMVVCPGEKGSRLEEIEASWNNAGGIKLIGRDHVIRGSKANYNGIEGIGGSNCDNCLVEYSEASYNLWKWPQTSNSAHGGGGKWTQTENSTFRHNKYIGNHGSGFWLDNHSSSNEIYGNYLDQNYKQGISLEHGSNDNRVFNNIVLRTRFYTTRWNGIGINVYVSDGNVVAYNTLMLNEGSGVTISGDNRGVATNTVVYNNLFIDNIQARYNGESQIREIQVSGTGPTGSMTPWQRIKSHRIDGNAYWYRNPEYASHRQSTFMLKPATPSGGNLYTNVLSEWQDTGAGYDANGVVANLDLPTVVSPTDPVEGWLMVANSQYLGRAVALPSDIAPILTDCHNQLRLPAGGAVGAHELLDAPLPPPPPSGGDLGEVGRLTIGQNDADQWHAVSFENNYSNPVVVMGPASYNGAEATTVRVRNVSASGFEFQLDEWDYLNGPHTEETVSYVVVEAGTHQLADGTVLEAGYVNNADDSWKSTSFAASFSSKPVVLAQTASVNGAAAVVTRLNNITKTGFSVRVQEEENNSGQHAQEAVAYIAIEPTATTSGVKLEAGRTGNSVTETWSSISFTQSYGQNGALLANIQSNDGGDPVGLRYTNLSASGVDVMLEEEQSKNNEVQHTSEDVGYLVFQTGTLEGNSAPAARMAEGGIPAATDILATQEVPQQYALEGNYPNPFNPQTTIRYALPETASIQLAVFDALGRRVALLAEGSQSAGQYEAVFDAHNLPSGVYFYRLTAGSFVEMKKMILMK